MRNWGRPQTEDSKRRFLGSPGRTRTDGSPEIAIVNMIDKPTLLKNVGPRQNAITLTGTRSNHSANRRALYRGSGQPQADCGGGERRQLLFAEFAHALFRLGKSEKADRIEVRWPAGETQAWCESDYWIDRRQRDGCEPCLGEALGDNMLG